MFSQLTSNHAYRNDWIFHLLHSPLLVISPIVFNNELFRLIYLQYFFIVMLSYTFINGECPISYLAKIILDERYKAGENLSYYPEMVIIFKRNEYINIYFACATVVYLITLADLIFKMNIPKFPLCPAFFCTFVYFLFVRDVYFTKNHDCYPFVQGITRATLFITICNLSTYF